MTTWFNLEKKIETHLPHGVPVVELVRVTSGEIEGVLFGDLVVGHGFTDTLKMREKRRDK